VDSYVGEMQLQITSLSLFVWTDINLLRKCDFQCFPEKF